MNVGSALLALLIDPALLAPHPVLHLVGNAVIVSSVVALFRPQSNRYFSGQRPAA